MLIQLMIAIFLGLASPASTTSSDNGNNDPETGIAGPDIPAGHIGGDTGQVPPKK